MKRIIKFTLMLLALFLTNTVSAHDIVVNGIYYNINGNELTVTYKGRYHNQHPYSGDITIPSTVTYNGAIYPVTSIGEFAFIDCDSLTSIIIPNSITSIGDYAFEGCSSLTCVNIPFSVTAIGECIFFDCRDLNQLSVDNENPIFDSRDNCNAIIETTSNTLIAGCHNSIIPNTVNLIGKRAFYGCSTLTNLHIPSSVTTICSKAFEECIGLTHIIIPNSVTEIGEYAFSGCTGLSIIDVPNSVNIINSGTFSYCNNLSEIILPNSIKSIGNYAFSNCTGLVSIDIPNSVISIGDYSFSECSSLVNASIGNSVTHIGFKAFSNCNSLVNIIFPNSVTYIDRYAFEGTSWYENQPDGLIYAGLIAYKYKGAMIDETSITLRDGTIGIADYIFLNRNKLTNIIIPNSVTYIGNCAFSGCSKLANVDIPNSVTSIGSDAFKNCSVLSRLIISNSITEIGSYAFSDCPLLIDVYSNITDPSIIAAGIDLFKLNDTWRYALRTLHVPAGSIDAYQASDWFNYFGLIVEIEDSPAISLKGDINDDGVINIADVTALIKIILNN